MEEEELVCRDPAPYRPVLPGLGAEGNAALAAAAEQPELVPCVLPRVQS